MLFKPVFKILSQSQPLSGRAGGFVGAFYPDGRHPPDFRKLARDFQQITAQRPCFIARRDAGAAMDSVGNSIAIADKPRQSGYAAFPAHRKNIR